MIAARIGKPIKVMLADQLIGALSGAEVISGSAPRNLVIQGKKTKRHSKTNHQDLLLFCTPY